MPSQHLPNQVSIPDFKQLVIFTGNVMLTTTTANKHWNKKTNTELVQAIKDTLHVSLHTTDIPSYQYFAESGLLEVPDLRCSSRIAPEVRNEIEVTAKLFYLDGYKETHIDKAIHHLKELLDIDSIDTFIVSSNSIDKAWKHLENYVDNGVISKLGLSDFDYTELNDFIQSPIKTKPTINQVHVAECCSLPQDLIQLGKSQNIQITFNGDSEEILTTETLSELLRQEYLIDGSASVQPRWVLKYNVFYKNRSVVADKGYIVVSDRL